MNDIATIWAGSAGDWALLPSGLLAGQDLETAVLISLFSDAEAAVDDAIPDATTDPRGWWGDMGADRPLGSKLWLLGRSKETGAVLRLARQYAEDALRWLLDDGVASSVEVQAAFVRPGMLGLTVTISEVGGGVLAKQYAWVWQGVQ